MVVCRGGRTCMRPITYFYLEFHVSLNSCNTKPANVGVHTVCISIASRSNCCVSENYSFSCTTEGICGSTMAKTVQFYIGFSLLYRVQPILRKSPYRPPIRYISVYRYTPSVYLCAPSRGVGHDVTMCTILYKLIEFH